MQEPLFGTFLHHFSTTSRQAARIRGAPNPGRVQMKRDARRGVVPLRASLPNSRKERIDDEHLIFLSFVVNSNHFLASPAPIFIRRLHKLTTAAGFPTFKTLFRPHSPALNSNQPIGRGEIDDGDSVQNVPSSISSTFTERAQIRTLFMNSKLPLWRFFSISKTECCAKKRLQNQNKNKSTDNTCDFLLICRNRIPVHPNYRKFGKKAYAKQDIYIPIGFSIIFFYCHCFYCMQNHTYNEKYDERIY